MELAIQYNCRPLCIGTSLDTEFRTKAQQSGECLTDQAEMNTSVAKEMFDAQPAVTSSLSLAVFRRRIRPSSHPFVFSVL